MAKKSARKSRWKTRGIDALIPVKMKHSCGDPSCSHDHHVHEVHIDESPTKPGDAAISEAPLQES